jgi:hemoglobin-like flavoprotein
VTSPEDRALIERSLEIAAQQSGDLTTAVYARLFRERPELEAMFVMDTDGAVRGEMLSRVFAAILDFIGDRAYAQNWINAEATTHEGYLVPREDFARFFEIVGEAVRDACGEAWNVDMQAAWVRLNSAIAAFTAQAS